MIVGPTSASPGSPHGPTHLETVTPRFVCFISLLYVPGAMEIMPRRVRLLMSLRHNLLSRWELQRRSCDGVLVDRGRSQEAVGDA